MLSLTFVFGRYYTKGEQPIEASKKVTVQNNSQQEKSFKLEVKDHSERKGIQDAVKNGVKVAVPSSITVSSGSITGASAKNNDSNER